MGGTAEAVRPPAVSASDERTSGVQSPPAPLPVQWPTLLDAEREEEDHDKKAPRSRPEPDEEQFFSAGEEGVYEGGPASLIPEAHDQFEHESLDTIPALRPRTPAQEQRRRNFILIVAGVIGFGLAVSGFAVWRANRTHSAEPPVASDAAPESQAPQTAAAKAGEPLIPAPPPAEPEPAAAEPELPSMAMPEASPGPARPAGEGVPVAPPMGAAPLGAREPLPAGPSVPAAGPVGPTPRPRASNPVTGRPPTAAFPIEP